MEKDNNPPPYYGPPEPNNTQVYDNNSYVQKGFYIIFDIKKFIYKITFAHEKS